MRYYTTVRLLSLLAVIPAGAADLFRDDFSSFPPGWLSSPVGTLNGAIQEYHYLAHRGVPLGKWENAIGHLDAWIVSDEDGKPYLEQHFMPGSSQFQRALFITGDPEWSDYSVEAKVKPLAQGNMAGLVFRYHTNRHHYVFALREGKAWLGLHLPLEQKLRVPEYRELASAPFPYDVTRYYLLKVENSGGQIRCLIDGKQVLTATDTEIPKGKAGVAASGPARFQDFRVTAGEDVKRAIEARIAAREAELEKLRAGNPRPKLWKKFETPRFGAGRNVRFGDLDGDKRVDMLIAQNIPRVRGDAFDAISCLTAVNLDGKVLWQKGRPDPRNGLLTNDTPFQIHDVDGDGLNEVVLVRDFQIQILDGRTGEVKRRVWTPQAPPAKESPYELVSGDSIAFVNVSGDKRQREILLKDRYQHFWVFSSDLKLLWKGEGQTGHYPYSWDIDGDGRDEIAIGYALWDHNGKTALEPRRGAARPRRRNRGGQLEPRSQG